MLGTGTPLPDPDRCGSGTAVLTRDGWYLVDCGRGVAQRIVEAGLALGELRGVLLTHHHSDHVSDLATIAMMRWTSGVSEPLSVVCAAGPSVDFAHTCLEPFPDAAFHRQALPRCGPRPTVDVRSFDATDELQVVYRLGPIAILSVLVDHAPIEAAVGYRFVVDGSVVAISGDTAVCAGMELLAEGADLLIHEAVREDLASEDLLAWNASARSVGGLASRSAVAHLMLTHLIPAPATAQDEGVFEAQAREGGYSGHISIAKDHLRIDV